MDDGGKHRKDSQLPWKDAHHIAAAQGGGGHTQPDGREKQPYQSYSSLKATTERKDSQVEEARDLKCPARDRDGENDSTLETMRAALEPRHSIILQHAHQHRENETAQQRARRDGDDG